jgi:integrase
MNNNVIQSLIKITSEANKFLVENADYLKSHASNQTKNDYNKVFKKLISNLNQQNQKITAKNLLQIATDTQAKNTWFKRRASLKYVAHQNLIDELRRYKKLVIKIKKNHLKQSQEINESFNKHFQVIEFYFSLLKDLPQKCPLVEVVQRKSKRKTISQLNHNWREMIVEQVSTKYQLPTLVSALTGCRAKELVKGVEVIKSKGLLHLTINTAKVKKNGKIIRKINQDNDEDQPLIAQYEFVNYMAGQEYRTLTYSLDQGGFVEQFAQYLDENIKTTISIDSEDNFYNALRYAGKKLGRSLWKKKPSCTNQNISAYCFRHQSAADMKASNMNKDDVSIALGHLSAATKSQYGNHNLSKGGVVPIAVVGAEPKIKPLHESRKTNIKKRRNNKLE